jgi:glycine betaine catabolism B
MMLLLNNSMNVKLLKKQMICVDHLYIEFDLLDQRLDYKAGQFFSLTLLNPPFTDERGNSRFFGFVNSPTEIGKIAMVTKIGMSAFKKSLMEMPIGSEVKIDSVGGHTVLPDNINQKIVLIAGGIGIAPFMSILHFVKEKKLTYGISLIYVNKDQESAVFFDEIKLYSKENILFKFFPVISEIESINPDLIRNESADLNNRIYFITGEQKFVLQSFKLLKELRVEAKNISMEIFAGY